MKYPQNAFSTMLGPRQASARGSSTLPSVWVSSSSNEEREINSPFLALAFYGR